MPMGTDFQGGVFSDALPGKRAGATIRLGFDGVEATTASGERFQVPFATCVLEQGGASGRMIFCHAPDRSVTIYSEEKGFLESLRHAGGGQLAPELARVVGAAQQERSKQLKWVAIALVAIGLTGLVGYFAVKSAASHAVELLPISVDEKIGELAMSSMPLQGKKVDDPVVVKAVEEMVQRLEPHTNFPGMKFNVTVVDANIVNAYCLPGGEIVLYTGLIEAATSPEQVAGVLGHEMAHATKRHGLKRIANSLGVVLAIDLVLGDVSGVVALAVELARQGMLTSHSREQETESDVEAVRMMSASGLDAAALAEFFGVLEKESGDVPGALAYFSSHPQLAERQKEIRALALKQPPQNPRPFTFDWAEVSRRAKRPGESRKKARDETLDTSR